MSELARIMIVDDEPLFVDLTHDLMVARHPTWEIFDAHNGKDAFKQLSKVEYDAVLSDFRMPGMSGITLLRALREGGQDCPFIFLTAYADQELMLEAIKLGAFELLDKVRHLDRIVQVVEHAVAYHQGLKKTDQQMLVQISEGDSLNGKQLLRIQQARRQLVQLRYQNSRGRKND